MDKKTLGGRIREARKNANLTQETLAEKADIGAIYLGEIERGLKMPSVSVFVKIVEALEVSADYLLRDAVSSGKVYVLDEIMKKMEEFTPKQRKTVSDILDAYIKNL
ncbi:MAG: XRE family transcriptional regulator [Ruminococcaceae bacterium]|nr:XRE family transcriptional regulator [Oscillospiraceae bacterium]